MATLDELQKQKPLIDRVLDFLSKNLRLLCILLGISCVLLGGFMWRGLKLQEWMFCLALLFFIINLYLVWSVKHGKDIPEFISTSRGIMTFGLIVISVALFAVDKDRGTHHIVLLMTIVLLCLVNYGLSRTYRNRWDMPDILFKKLVKIESLGVIIAGLQLIIAYPQLQLAYDSVSTDDITEFNKDLKQFQSHVEKFIIVDIPDSLVNENVEIARVFQKQIYAYSLFITNANWDREIPDKSLNIDSVFQTLDFRNNKDYKQLKNNQNLLNDYVYSLITMQGVRDVNKGLIANFTGTLRLAKTLKKIDEYYLNTADSTLLLSQVNKETQTNVTESLKEIYDLALNSSDSMSRALSEIKKITEDSSMDISVKARMFKKEVRKVRNDYNKFMNSPAFNTLIKSMDMLCMDYIAFLNIVQLKYAYNVDLDLSDSNNL